MTLKRYLIALPPVAPVLVVTRTFVPSVAFLSPYPFYLSYLPSFLSSPLLFILPFFLSVSHCPDNHMQPWPTNPLHLHSLTSSHSNLPSLHILSLLLNQEEVHEGPRDDRSQVKNNDHSKDGQRGRDDGKERERGRDDDYWHDNDYWPMEGSAAGGAAAAGSTGKGQGKGKQAFTSMPEPEPAARGWGWEEDEEEMYGMTSCVGDGTEDLRSAPIPC